MSAVICQPNVVHPFFPLAAVTRQAGRCLVATAVSSGLVSSCPIVAAAILDRLLHQRHVITT